MLSSLLGMGHMILSLYKSKQQKIDDFFEKFKVIYSLSSLAVKMHG